MSKVPSIRSVNALYLICMLLVITAGMVLQSWSPGWGLILTELLVILLPAYLFLRWQRLPALQALRLRWPGREIAAFSMLAGFGIGFLTLWLGTEITNILGYSLGLPPTFYPQNVGSGLVLLFGTLLAAPFCEEVLFRGIIQRSYEQTGPWRAILFVGFLFAIYHLSLLRLLALIPISIILGYTAWRSQSLASSMLAHFSYNLPASVLMVISSLRPDLQLDFFSNAFMGLFGLMVALTGVWLLRSRSSPDVFLSDEISQQRSDVESPNSGKRVRSGPARVLAAVLPLIIAIPVVAVLMGAEVVYGKFPERLAASHVSLGPANWTTNQLFRYEILSPTDEVVGEATCQISPQGQQISMDCSETIDAFESRKPGSFFKTDGYQGQRHVIWSADTLQLVEAHRLEIGQDGSTSLKADLMPAGDQLDFQVQLGDDIPQSLLLPPDVLLPTEWAWRFSTLPFNPFYAAKATLAWPNRWSSELDRVAPQIEQVLVKVDGAEPVATPAGNFIAWKVQIGHQTAWLDSQAPHTMLRFETDFVTYVLAEPPESVP